MAIETKLPKGPSNSTRMGATPGTQQTAQRNVAGANINPNMPQAPQLAKQARSSYQRGLAGQPPQRAAPSKPTQRKVPSPAPPMPRGMQPTAPPVRQTPVVSRGLPLDQSRGYNIFSGMDAEQITGMNQLMGLSNMTALPPLVEQQVDPKYGPGMDTGLIQPDMGDPQSILLASQQENTYSEGAVTYEYDPQTGMVQTYVNGTPVGSPKAPGDMYNAGEDSDLGNWLSGLPGGSSGSGTGSGTEADSESDYGGSWEAEVDGDTWSYDAETGLVTVTPSGGGTPWSGTVDEMAALYVGDDPGLLEFFEGGGVYKELKKEKYLDSWGNSGTPLADAIAAKPQPDNYPNGVNDGGYKDDYSAWLEAYTEVFGEAAAEAASVGDSGDYGQGDSPGDIFQTAYDESQAEEVGIPAAKKQEMFDTLDNEYATKLDLVMSGLDRKAAMMGVFGSGAHMMSMNSAVAQVLAEMAGQYNDINMLDAQLGETDEQQKIQNAKTLGAAIAGDDEHKINMGMKLDEALVTPIGDWIQANVDDPEVAKSMMNALYEISTQMFADLLNDGISVEEALAQTSLKLKTAMISMGYELPWDEIFG